MILKKEGIGLYIIHNPRCAGRTVNQLLTDNGFSTIINDKKIVKYKIYELCNLKYDTNYQYLHWHYDLIKTDLPKIVIIRDPIERFISTEVRYGHMEFDFPYDTEDNWFRLQKDFIGDDVYIWNLKDGFKENFCEWVSEIINHKIILPNNLKYKDDKEFGWIKKKKYSNDMIEKAKVYYKQDYDFFSNL
jgi:hypothetical protein